MPKQRRSMKKWGAWTICLTAVFLYTCKSQRQNLRSQSGAVLSGDESAKEEKKDQQQESTPPPSASPAALTRTVQSNAAAFGLISSKQLENRIHLCVGTGRSKILASFLSQGEQSQGAFLNPEEFRAGDDIIAVSRIMFDGDEAELRAGTRLSLVSIAYIGALQNVGNVVAGNCAEATKNKSAGYELCQCDTGGRAEAMLKRCLMTLDPNSDEFKRAVVAFVGACSLDQRVAVASLISSMAFAASP